MVIFTTTSSRVAANPPPIVVGDQPFSFLSSREIWIALAIMLFGLAMAGFCLMMARSTAINADQIIRIAALLLIVTGTLLLVATGYDAQQISPALGLLGAIVGYLLGKSDSQNLPVDSSKKANND